MKQSMRNYQSQIDNSEWAHPFSATWGIIFALIVTVLMPPAAQANGDFLISGSVKIVTVVDGDTARVLPMDAGNELMGALRREAEIAQANYQRKLDLDRIFGTGWNRPTILVRISNIDTEESVHRDSSRNTAGGAQASQFAKQRFEDRFATLTCHTIGYYGRPICNIETGDGDWGQTMIENGFSDYVTKYGRHPDRTWHIRYQSAAR